MLARLRGGLGHFAMEIVRKAEHHSIYLRGFHQRLIIVEVVGDSVFGRECSSLPGAWRGDRGHFRPLHTGDALRVNGGNEPRSDQAIANSLHLTSSRCVAGGIIPTRVYADWNSGSPRYS